MHVSWWEIAVASVSLMVFAWSCTRHLRNTIREQKEEIARLRAQLEKEQEFSAQLISMMPGDEEEPSN